MKNIFNWSSNPQTLSAWSQQVKYVDAYGSQVWLKNGKLHRSDGPAIIYSDGIGIWYKNGLRHRDGGPAYFDPLTGDQIWYRDGEAHREDGPAVIQDGRIPRWFLNGIELEGVDTQKKFEQYMKNYREGQYDVGTL